MVWRPSFGFRNESSTTVSGNFTRLCNSKADVSIRIISQILSGDSSELKKRAKSIEQDKEAPSKAHLTALKDYCAKPAEEQQIIRGFSGTRSDILQYHRTNKCVETNPESLTFAILSSNPSLPALDARQQTLALSYLSIQLSIRDRDQLIAVLCHSSPDLLTQSIRSILPAYDPIIRALHNAADLSGGVSDLEAFLNDLIKVSTVDGKSKGENAKLPTVEDFVTLLQKHQGSSHRFIHQVLKNGKDLSEWYHDYAAHAAKQYQQKSSLNVDDKEGVGAAAAGDFTPRLQTLLSTLSEQDKTAVLREIDAHATYLSSLTTASTDSMKTIISNLAAAKSETSKGPGMYLSRWQSLMDEAPITPAISKGPVRSGKSESVRLATTVDIDGEEKGDAANVKEVDESVASPPDVSRTVELLAPGFREILRGLVHS